MKIFKHILAHTLGFTTLSYIFLRAAWAFCHAATAKDKEQARAILNRAEKETTALGKAASDRIQQLLDTELDAESEGNVQRGKVEREYVVEKAF
ncbi:MAG: hypothetical protein HC925_02895 [Coleofasciculaceae cyanobacterium SM2_3_26]|nr:hypothetical protein [Coleofasciculaceae cyanobacterium SM2_3_26]